MQASCKRTQASWELAVQEGKQMEGLKLVSRQFNVWLASSFHHFQQVSRQTPAQGSVAEGGSP